MKKQIDDQISRKLWEQLREQLDGQLSWQLSRWLSEQLDEHFSWQLHWHLWKQLFEAELPSQDTLDKLWEQLNENAN